MTKDPKTQEFIMIIQFAKDGNLRSFLSSNFRNMLWKGKINLLYYLINDLKCFHGLGYIHKDFHSGNILQDDNSSYISDFGLSGPANDQKSDNKIYGVLPYIAPEVLNGEPYTLSSDIYSFGVIMAELSTGRQPFYDRKHDCNLSLAICNGLRPEFGKGTPEIYKRLAHKCMDANPNDRPAANKLFKIIEFWSTSITTKDYDHKVDQKQKEIKAMFEEGDKNIPNISISHEKDPDAIYISKAFTFSNLPKPVNSPVVISYINDNEGIA
jgi:serine/threonine protein kinase